MADRPVKAKRRRSKQLLLEKDEADDGISNPSLDEETAAHYEAFSQSQTEGETSTAEMMEENEQAEVLKGDLRSRHRRRKRELSKLVSPKDDLTGELKTVKLDSRKKVEETEHEDELAEALVAAGAAAEAGPSLPAEEDATIPMPLEEEETVPEAPATPPKIPEPSVEETPRALDRTVSSKEEETEAEKPPPDRRRSTMREKMASLRAKAREEAEAEIEQEERDERKKTLGKKKETRFEELDENEVRRLEERTERMRKMRLDRAKQQEALSFMPTQEQSFDFFTRVWEPEPEEVLEAERKEREREAKEKEDKPEGEEEETVRV